MYYTTGIDLNNVRLKETWRVSSPSEIEEVYIHQFEIYPNPTTSVLYVKVLNPNIQLNKIEAYNSLGQQIFPEFSQLERTVEIDLRHWTIGMYFILLHYTDKVEAVRIIKR